MYIQCVSKSCNNVPKLQYRPSPQAGSQSMSKSLLLVPVLFVFLKGNLWNHFCSHKSHRRSFECFDFFAICYYMVTKESPLKNSINETCQPIASLLPLSVPSCFFVKVSVPGCIISQIYFLPQPPIHLAFSFSFALLLMQIPWLIL